MIFFKRPLFLLFISTCCVYGQNLVPNPSFENITACPSGWSGDIIFAAPWTSGNQATPDLYNVCNTGQFGVPNNLRGVQNAKTGVGYAAIICGAKTTAWREYLRVPLLNPLQAGKKYCGGFFVSMADSVIQSINRFGMHFSTNAIYQADQFVYSGPSYTPQIENPTTNFLDDKQGWELVSGLYTATGGEQYVTIGNFSNSANTTYKNVIPGSVPSPYYYIDDVSLVLMPEAGNDTTVCAGDPVKLGGAPTVSSDTMIYSWTSSPSGFSSVELNPTVAPQVTTTYYLEATDTICNCTIRDSVTVFISGNCGTPQPFPCDGAERLYFFMADTNWQPMTKGYLAYISNYTSGTPTVTTLFPMPSFSHNALGANPVDGYLYYQEQNLLKRLDASGNTATTCNLGFQSKYGCFDILGRYWTIDESSGDLMAIDISTCAVIKGPFNVAGQIGSGIFDLVFNPYDCNLYFARSRCDTNGVIDPNYTSANFNTASTCGGVAIGSDGDIYGVSGGGFNGIGDLSKIDFPANTFSPVFTFTPTPTNGSSDMASFICGYQKADFAVNNGCAPFNASFTDKSAGPIATWLWDFGDVSSGVNNTSTLSNPTHVYNTPGTYSVTLIVGTGSNLCYNFYDTIQSVITVHPSVPVLASSSTNSSSCSSCDGTATVMPQGGGSYIYSWNNQPSQTTSVASALCVGTYSVLVTDINGCSAVSSVTVAAFGSPPVTFSVDDSIACGFLCVNFDNTTSNSASCYWEFGDGNTSALCSASHCYSSPGDYSVSLKITDTGGCSDSLIESNLIHVYPVPESGFSANPLTGASLNDPIHFTDQSLGATKWLWDFGDASGFISTLENPSISYDDTGSYIVQQIVFNDYGCSDTAEQLIEVRSDFTFYVPNTFTPDGNGINDFFPVKGMGIDVANFEMYIYDRWGNMIYKSSNINEPWTGYVMGSKKQSPVGVYVWKINVKDILGKSHSYIGHVNLIR